MRVPFGSRPRGIYTCQLWRPYSEGTPHSSCGSWLRGAATDDLQLESFLRHIISFLVAVELPSSYASPTTTVLDVASISSVVVVVVVIVAIATFAQPPSSFRRMRLTNGMDALPDASRQGTRKEAANIAPVATPILGTRSLQMASQHTTLSLPTLSRTTRERGGQWQRTYQGERRANGRIAWQVNILRVAFHSIPQTHLEHCW